MSTAQVCVNISLMDDGIIEPPERFSVNWTLGQNFNGRLSLSSATTTVTIEDSGKKHMGQCMYALHCIYNTSYNCDSVCLSLYMYITCMDEVCHIINIINMMLLLYLHTTHLKWPVPLPIDTGSVVVDEFASLEEGMGTQVCANLTSALAHKPDGGSYTLSYTTNGSPGTCIADTCNLCIILLSLTLHSYVSCSRLVIYTVHE